MLGTRYMGCPRCGMVTLHTPHGACTFCETKNYNQTTWEPNITVSSTGAQLPAYDYQGGPDGEFEPYGKPNCVRLSGNLIPVSRALGMRIQSVFPTSGRVIGFTPTHIASPDTGPDTVSRDARGNNFIRLSGYRIIVDSCTSRYMSQVLPRT